MPRKPKRPCSFPNCPKLTDGRYCEEHQRVINSQYNKYGRASEAKKRYGRAWEAIRKMYAAKHPLCEMCQKDGRLVKVEHVHHIKPLGEGGTNDEENLMSLCQSCHSRLHAQRGDSWRSHKGKAGSVL